MIEETLDNNVEELDTSENPDEELELDLDEEEQAIDEPTAESSEDVEALKAEINKLKGITARLLKKKEEKVVKSDKTNSSLTREEAILYAKGYTEEEVELANKLAKISGDSPLVAIKDPFFKSRVDDRIKKERASKASLGASGGSSKYTPQDIGNMPREEHAKLYHEIMSKV